jgi:hypothetical protein
MQLLGLEDTTYVGRSCFFLAAPASLLEAGLLSVELFESLDDPDDEAFLASVE